MPHEGPIALAEFRRLRLLQTLRQTGVGITDIRARFIHFLDLSRPLTAEEQVRLRALLAYGSPLDCPLPLAAVVVPRPGTLSPWSSKATDIAHRCGLDGVRRIERGVAWLVAVGAGDGAGDDSDDTDIRRYFEADAAGDNADRRPHLKADAVRNDAVRNDADRRRHFEANGAGDNADRRRHFGANGAGGDTDRQRELRRQLAPHIHDRMTESVRRHLELEAELFTAGQPRPLRAANTTANHIEDAIAQATTALGLQLDAAELDHLTHHYRALNRPPTDVELMMFAQINSEHCRHKIFNAAWTIDGGAKNHSLFDMIRNTHALHPGRVLSAYRDNAAVVRGWPAQGFTPDPANHVYRTTATEHHLVIKVETHNHPSAISPFPGAATGAGGEIRDEAATGRGARAKAGLTGFCVSNLRLPEHRQPWEQYHGKPATIASALDIMLEGPIGAASYNNEFGRPAILGFFRSFELTHAGQRFGYHKPMTVAGGLGNIRPEQVHKSAVVEGMHVVVLGGPAMLIGLGGGAASSAASGAGDAALDFASVQRGNAEMQRRCQEVIDTCWALGEANPIGAIHDVGAGGLSNAIPELVDTGDLGAELALRRIPNADPAMSPMEIWCNEAQERYVLTIADGDLARFLAIAQRERCPAVSVGRVNPRPVLRLLDQTPAPLPDGPTPEALIPTDLAPVDLPMKALLGRVPRMHREAHTTAALPLAPCPIPTTGTLEQDILAVLNTPTVGDKSFLITIGDRTVGGLVHRDQMVGPHQVPVADCAITLTDFEHLTGEAMAMGERPPIALLDPSASARMAIAEALTNLAAAPVGELGNVALCANWMAASGHPGQDAALYQAVAAVGLELCPALGISIPVGKDSLSMQTVWQENHDTRQVVSPLSLVVSAFAPVTDVRKSVTPALDATQDSVLLLVDLALGATRMGGSTLAVVSRDANDEPTDGQTAHEPGHDLGQSLGGAPPDVVSPQALRAFFEVMQSLIADRLVLAYHDRSDGGLVATVAEMCFAGGCGAHLDIGAAGTCDTETSALLLCEELGAVLQVAAHHRDTVAARFAATPLAGHVHLLGEPTRNLRLTIHRHGNPVADLAITALRQAWSRTTHLMARRRDHPQCANEAHEARLSPNSAGLGAASITLDTAAVPPLIGSRPRVAVLREQGVNGHIEMAAAFHAAGFEAVDVHMSDIQSGTTTLSPFQVLAACGGFSYGDVLGGGGGWAASIRFNARAHDAFAGFFADPSTLTLGVCNGCQMLAQLTTLIPGSEGWPRFVRNRSEQFEARLSLVEVMPSPSLLLAGMDGARLPVPVAHGEGRALFAESDDAAALTAAQRVALRYVDGTGAVANAYPANPNGSPMGITGLTTADGRITIMMPHPERAFRTVQLSWHPPEWQGMSPWLRMFINARRAMA